MNSIEIMLTFVPGMGTSVNILLLLEKLRNTKKR
jgi:hypothetical protein